MKLSHPALAPDDPANTRAGNKDLRNDPFTRFPRSPSEQHIFNKLCVWLFFCFLFFSQGPLAGCKSVYINPHTPILGLLFKTTADKTNSPPHSSTSTLLRLSLTFSHPPLPRALTPSPMCVCPHAVCFSFSSSSSSLRTGQIFSLSFSLSLSPPCPLVGCSAS